ncbi:MAG: GNAT family N-acetyltransferase [Acidobacteria bacterium]|nr:GNAT family N-acetyltransferase [Acidobacteriota bacterium]
MPAENRPHVVIRDIETIAEMREVEELQKEVWGFGDREVVPVYTLKPTRDVGGILVGAFDGGELVGFVYAFVGHERGRVHLHSDMLAVRPEYRDRRLGYQLKLAQRERALAHGITRMTWTFDPLQSRNAYLNFAKLGVLSDSYKVNYYGEETTSFLHRGVGTDRLWVTWLLDSVRVERRLNNDPASETPAPNFESLARLVRMLRDGSPERNSLSGLNERETLALEIPHDIGALQQHDTELAVLWREATREAFVDALAAGYLIEDFSRVERDGHRCGAYRLSHSKKIEDFSE